LKTSGLYLNELIHLSVVDHEDSDLLFQSYQLALQNIGKLKLSSVLRTFEWQLLKHNGFEISIGSQASSGDWVAISENHELIIQSTSKNGQCKVADLHNFIKGLPLKLESQIRINAFMEKAIAICLSHRKIYSKELIKSIIKSN
jgi:recombinational DNA repair protein (RecF pathway)